MRWSLLAGCLLGRLGSCGSCYLGFGILAGRHSDGWRRRNVENGSCGEQTAIRTFLGGPKTSLKAISLAEEEAAGKVCAWLIDG